MEILKRRILEIAYKNKLSHLSSYFSTVGIVDEIFKTKLDDDIFILSSGHASLAMYVAIEKYYGINAEELFKKQGGHPHLDEDNKIYCSTGSLGMGLTVAVGRALANREREVYCIISDGECAEGSIWESLRFIEEKNIQNLHVYVNINGYSAYSAIDVPYLEKRLKAFLPNINLRRTNISEFPFLRGINGHYHVMDVTDYHDALESLL